MERRIKNIPVNRPWRDIGLWDVKDLTLLDNRLTDADKVVSTGRTLLSRNIICMLMVLIC
jgi:hypothetical protein